MDHQLVNDDVGGLGHDIVDCVSHIFSFQPAFRLRGTLRMAVEVRVHQPGIYDAHFDAEGMYFFAQGGGKRVLGVLAGTVQRSYRKSALRHIGGNVDNMPLLAGFHGRKGVAATEEGPLDIHVHDLVPFPGTDFFHLFENPKSRVVYEEIQPAKFPDKGFHSRFDHPLVGYVTGKDADLGGAIPQTEGSSPFSSVSLRANKPRWFCCVAKRRASSRPIPRDAPVKKTTLSVIIFGRF